MRSADGPYVRHYIISSLLRATLAPIVPVWLTQRCFTQLAVYIPEAYTRVDLRCGRRLTAPTQTAMCHPLPPEILDLIVDQLHDEPTALRACCLVSKSWVPRSRAHLFAHIELSHTSFERWMKAFPDPLNSPARCTRTLSVHEHQLVAVAGPDVAHRICALPLHNVVRLSIFSESGGSGSGWMSLVPFYGLSPTIRSLRLVLFHSAGSSEIFGLVCSFPLLEDFDLRDFGCWSWIDRWTPPSTSPRLTGTLALYSMAGGIDLIIRRLLALPNGLNFTKIVLRCVRGASDLKSIADLVSGCSGTLETLEVSDHYPCELLRSLCLIDTLLPHSARSTATSFDLSVATKLKHLTFKCAGPSIQWITVALRTVESKNLQGIALWPNTDVFAHIDMVTEPILQQWYDLDRLLVQLWTSHSIRPKVTYETGGRRMDMKDHVPHLLPELTKSGVVDLCLC